MNKNNNPRISILIPVYNNESSIDKCFKSVKNQTFQDFEIICVNDGSDAKTSKRLFSWQQIFGPEKFILVNNFQNLGITKSLNIALKKAAGEYIARIDADDYWEKDKLEKQINFMKSHPEHGIVGTNHINIYAGNSQKKFIKLSETHEQISQKLFRRNPFAHSCILAKTDLIKKIGGYDEKIRYGQDYDLWLRCFSLTKFHNLQEFLCTRKIDDISIKKQNAQMWQSIKTRLKYIRKYKYSQKNYLYLLEPLLVIMAPDFIKNMKRKYL